MNLKNLISPTQTVLFWEMLPWHSLTLILIQLSVCCCNNLEHNSSAWVSGTCFFSHFILECYFCYTVPSRKVDTVMGILSLCLWVCVCLSSNISQELQAFLVVRPLYVDAAESITRTLTAWCSTLVHLQRVWRYVTHCCICIFWRCVEPASVLLISDSMQRVKYIVADTVAVTWIYKIYACRYYASHKKYGVTKC